MHRLPLSFYFPALVTGLKHYTSTEGFQIGSELTGKQYQTSMHKPAAEAVVPASRYRDDNRFLDSLSQPRIKRRCILQRTSWLLS